MAGSKQDGFFSQVDKFFKRVQNKDLIKLSSNSVNVMSTPQSKDEAKTKRELRVFKQYLQSKNWNLKHIELFDEYRRMDATFPTINAALRIYSQELCLSGDSIITVSEGDKTIKEIYDQHKDLFLVQSYDYKNNRVCWNECHGIISNGIKKVFEVTVQRNITKQMESWDKIEIAKFKCTDNHKIYLGGNKYKSLSELSIGDSIFAYYRDIDPKCRCKVDSFVSTIILKIDEVGEEEVFDLINVTPHPHFSLKLTDSFYVVVHNCSKDTNGNVMKVIADDLAIKKSLEECFFKNLKINTRGYLIAKSLLKFGNLYGYLNTRRGVGVTDLIYLPPESMRIHLLESSDRLDEFKYHWYGYGGALQFDPWEVVHWKITEDLESEPYGQSILRAIVDTWRRIVLMRESLIIYRITRAPQRYLFKIDTSGMDPDAALLYADQLKKNLKKKPLVNPTTGEIDYKYNAMPISGKTPIPLLSGDIKTIAELAKEYDEGKENYVYSIQDKTHQIVPGKIKWCGKNYTANKLIRIWTIDDKGNECYVDSAPEHPFMRRNGERIRADELKEGDSLMPLYRSEEIIVKGGTCYETIYNPATEKYEFTHRLIAKEVKGKKKNVTTIHHVDFCRYNNRPDNLKWMNYIEHLIYHSNLNKERNSHLPMLEAMKKPENIEKQKKAASEYQLKYWKENKKERAEKRTVSLNDKIINSLAEEIKANELMSLTDAVEYLNNVQSKAIWKLNKKKFKKQPIITPTILRKRLKSLGYNNFLCFKALSLNKTTSECRGEIASLNMKKYHDSGIINYKGIENPNYKGLPTKEEILKAIQGKQFKNFNCFKDFFKQKFPSYKSSLYIYDMTKVLEIDRETFAVKYMLYDKSNLAKVKSQKDFVGYKNHKVSRLEVLENISEDVYCMTVVGLNDENDRHNFGIGGFKENSEIEKSNIFIFNSIEEDFYMPISEGSMSDISVIEGANNMDQVEDYKIIFQDLYSGLMIPNAYLNFESDLCISANTLVSTNEGPLTIKKIAESFEKNKTTKLFTLSVNKFGLITTGKIIKCWATKKVSSLHRVSLSNDSFVDCTENHPFLLQEKLEYKRADELKVGDKLRNKFDKDIHVTNVEIISLNEEEWVYDLQMSDDPNFVLDCGIFVHNSNKAALSQEDLRFSSAVRQYQSYFIEGLLHVGLVQLYLNGFGKDELEAFEIQMNNNSTLAEKNKNELLQQRFDLAHSALDTSSGGIALMSYIDTLKNVLKFSDDEISRTFKNQMIEKKLIWRLNQLTEQGFYEEPDPDKKKAIMKGMTDSTEDVFKELQFESDSLINEKTGPIREILTEKVEKEISYLSKPLKESATRKQIDMVVDLQKERLERNTKKTYLDLGLKGRDILKEEEDKS